MNVDTETLRQVFDALDNGNKGYITVEQFTSALENFYTSMSHDGPKSPRLDRTHSMDVDNIVNALDPEKDGIISFEDFQSAFQNFFNCQDRDELKGKSMTVNLHGRRVSITPEDYVMQSGETEPDLKTEDSGFLESAALDYTPSRPSTLLLSRRSRPSSCRRTPQGQSTKNGNSFQENTVGSPFSGSRSDLMLDDVDSNFEQLRNQMRQMEAKMESMSSSNGSDGLSGRLRDENARLSASVAVLEERLKEIEARYQRDLESERSHLEALMARTKRTYEAETENLRARCQRLESDLSDATINLGKTKVELDSARAEGKRTNEALLDAQDKINALMEQLNNRSDEESWELKKAIADRDNALNALKEVNSKVGNGPRISLGMDTVARLEEMQQLINRLKEENKTLKTQLQDAQEESWFKNLKEGQNYLALADKSVEQELDNLTKEEVVELLVQEKHANNELRAYMNTLLGKVMMNHPELLENK